MKLRLSIVLPHGGTHDIVLSCDATTTVADIARSLIEAGFGADPRLAMIAERRLAPVTLRAAAAPGRPPVLLDPMAVIAESGLHSGSVVQPVAEFASTGRAERLVAAAGYAEVLTGAQQGVVFSLIAGSNLIGRDPACRVHLIDRSVSRQHAEVLFDSDGRGRIVDLDSANGVVHDGARSGRVRVIGQTVIRLGGIGLRITPGPAMLAAEGHPHRVLHTRPPRVAPRFPSSERELPAPPAPRQPSRIPLLAMIAPMLMGGAHYAVTRSPMSLTMVAFTPLMMIGSWLDGKFGGGRGRRREIRRFADALRAEQHELSELRTRETEMRAQESPSLGEVQSSIERRDEGLWNRRPEHRSFLEVRFGAGALPSRTRVIVPERSGGPDPHWETLRRTAEEFAAVSPVPVTDNLDRCGSIGVAGPSYWAEGAAAALVLQLAGLHSPHELFIAAFAGERHTPAWSWLKWLPHVDPVASPLPVWPLADTPASSTRLLAALEGLLALRSASGGHGTIRSHLDERLDRTDSGHASVARLPALPVIVVLVLEDGGGDPARLIEIAENGPDRGIHVIWVAPDRSGLPAACRTFMEIGPGHATVHYVRSARSVELTAHEHIDAAVAQSIARSLAPVEDVAARELDESDLPRSVQLCDLFEDDPRTGAAAIARAWERSGSRIAQWVRGRERAPVSLAATVGQSTAGPMVVDLREEGPHALIGGTTGSGKSEFLQSWIMSMAARVSPERLTFLLVDYKGGAAFAECVDLPHTVGLVTDLTPHLVRRALASLRAELRHREALLAAHGAKDLATLERASDVAAPPLLVIAIDEFAALATDAPEFVDGVIDIAQRGRSLGLHLIMATQRPAGVITDNLRANTNLRIALRMADAADSLDVIGTTDAAFFAADEPGRGALRAGPGRLAHFQTGYLGGRGTEGRRTAGIEMRTLAFEVGEPWNRPAEPSPGPARQLRPRDIERVRDSIVDAAERWGIPAPRRPWLAELPDLLLLDSVERAEPGPRQGIAVGLCDDPAAQAQYPLRIDFAEAGNISIIGASGTGKTSALLTVAAALAAETAADPVQLFAIDAAGGALGAVDALPVTAAVAPLNDTELVDRVLRHVSGIIADRGPRFAARRAGDLAAFRASETGTREPRIVLLIDGFAAFRQSGEALGTARDPLGALGEIMQQGRAVGVHVVLTCDRPAAIPAVLSASLQQQFVLRLAGPLDYGALGVDAEVLQDAPPGRALRTGDARESQFALVGADGLAGQVVGLETLAAELQARGVSRAPRVRNPPQRVMLETLPAQADRRPVYGIDVLDLAPVALPFQGLAVIAGPSGAGVSQAARSCAAAVQRAAADHGTTTVTVLLTFDPDGLRRTGSWSRIAIGASAVAECAESLCADLDGATGDRRVIVVERPAGAADTVALPRLVALAKAARRSETLVIFEFEPGTGAGIWDLYQALKQPRWGLSLQPDRAESQSPFREDLGRVRRADFAPGRGFAIENGRTVRVQVAFTDETVPPEPETAVNGRARRAGIKSKLDPFFGSTAE
ncbi:FtsK/SpoIIIE domain-containing protein [Leucobacter sp. gxy201]|uniref:FtsK/SpoIIIE domain-containing protein n=1 Tax=Leucobacter sp. gxy201 TaxID=2957200 RepID=UPI003DA00E0A